MKRLISFLLAIALIMSITSVAFAQEGTDLPNQIDRSTVWSYLDDNTDPSGNPSDEGYNRVDFRGF